MLTQIEALNYRCLRDVCQSVGPFQVLVGPNASGKTTLLDVVSLLGAVVDVGPERAVADRTKSFRDLVWMKQDEWIELAVEAQIPPERVTYAGKEGFEKVRYEVRLELDADSQQVGIAEERVLLAKPEPAVPQALLDFPAEAEPRESLLSAYRRKRFRTVITKVRDGNDNFYSEAHEKGGKGWFPSIRLGPRKSALANLPDDESSFPVATWLRHMLAEGVQSLALNSMLLRQASPPGRGKLFRPDGSNLPWVVADLAKRFPDRHAEWVQHLRTALPDLSDVETIERDDDHHRYLMLVYANGLRVPSWTASDGTLRMLALTLLAYLPEFSGIYLIEEPENGIHPRAVETVFQSLSSAYDAQILVASHSPVILGMAEPSQVLCFAKSPSGATSLVLGHRHPALQQWRGDPNLGVLFAGGVLG